jgi:uncharacterized protein YndB with AHSA1/START domain
MENQILEIKTALQVLKPANEVFEAIIDPAKMSCYFISSGSGILEEGKTIMWQFPEFDMEFPVRVGRIEKDRYISYFWEVEGNELLVEMTLTPKGPGKTIVNVTEKGMKNNEAGLKWLQGNAAGWANFLACLKAYLEYGINLRKGAFDFLADKE